MAESNSSGESRALRGDETTTDNRKLNITPEMIREAEDFATQKGVDKPKTVAELAQRYIEYCRQENHSRSNLSKLTAATQRLIAVAGDKHPNEVTVPMLAAARHLCVIAGVSRLVANCYMRVNVRMFKWGHAQGYCRADVAVRLQLLESLKKGRTEARDTPPRRPVPTDVLKATLRAVQGKMKRAFSAGHRKRLFRLWTIMALQLRTGMRPGEACGLTWRYMDLTGDLWVYKPHEHKTAHQGIEREIFIGPRSQRLILEWQSVAGTDPIFGIGVDAYRDLLYRLLDNANLPRFHPHQLRHGFATRIDRIGDAKAAQILLGHQNAKTTHGYIDPDTERARELIRRIG